MANWIPKIFWAKPDDQGHDNKKENKSSIFENLNKKKETDDFKPFKT